MMFILMALAAGSGQAATPASADSWTVIGTEAERRLVYGGPDGSDAQVTLRCERHGIRGTLSGIYTGEGREPRRATIVSGRASSNTPLSYVSNDSASGFQFFVSPMLPALRAFAQTGEVTFRATSGEIIANTTTPVERTRVASFLASCQ